MRSMRRVMSSTARLRCRPGLSMVELIIGMVILAIIGMALTRVLTSQARYFDHQKIANLARNVSRGPLNRMVSDLRMVEALGGVVEAQQNYVIVRVPYAMGVVCATTGGATHISLLPVDSAMYAAPGFSGYAWRGGQGTYRYVEAGPPTVSAGDLAICNASQIQTLTAANAKVIKITPQLTDTASVGTPVFFSAGSAIGSAAQTPFREHKASSAPPCRLGPPKSYQRPMTEPQVFAFSWGAALCLR